MSDQSTTLNRVISGKQFLGRPLILATLSAAFSAILLPIIVLAAAGITQLIVQRQSNASGLLDAVQSPSFPMNQIARIVSAIPLLHDSGSALTTLMVGLVVCVLLRASLRTLTHRIVNQHVGQGVNRLREHIQRHALRLNPGDLTGVQTETAAQLFKKTATSLENNARQWGIRSLAALCDLTVLITLMLLVQWRVGVECAIPIFVCWYILRIESARHEASAHLLTEQVERGLQTLTNDLDRSSIVAGYGMEQTEHDAFSRRLDSYQQRRRTLYHQRQMVRWTTLLIQLAAVILPAFILARHLIFGSLISLPVAVALATIVALILSTLRYVQDISEFRGSATVAAEEINQYLKRVPGVSQVVGARFLEPMSRILQFDQVTVETETNPELLSNLDLRINSGERVALLALNPIEANALVSLIPRFVDPVRGQVLIDGVDLRHATLESLRAEAVTVNGDEPPFNATILDNITAGQAGISRQDAIEASKIVHAESFIRQLPRGYETDLSEYRQLEPGQLFRLSLARAVARNPALMIIREPETPLDDETKAMLDDTYHRICANRTVLFLPTRLSTVKKCHRIVMIHHGRVVEDGPHDQLVRTSELYRHWEYMRFNAFRNGRVS